MVFREHPHQGDIQRTLDGDMCGNGSIERAVEILWRETVDIERNIRYQGSGEQHPVVQHSCVEERLQDTPRASGRRDDIDLVPPLERCLEGRVSSVCQDFAGLHIGDEGRSIMDMVGGIFPGIAVHDTLGLALERLMKRATDAFPLAPGSQALEQMRCLVG